MSRNRVLAALLVVLAVGLVTAAVLGPLVLGRMQYRTSPTTLNQLLGGDAAVLFVVAPVALLAAWLVARGRTAGPLLACGVGAFGVYTYMQVVVGQEYLRLPGNVERFFPLLLGIFVLAEATLVLGWLATPQHLPSPRPAMWRTTGAVLVLLAVFLIFGQHLRPMLTAWEDPGSLIEYSSSPTPFWLVKLMDLGIIVPLALVAGVGALRRRPWALRLAYPLLTAYSLLGVAVTAMAVVMLARHDPDASAGTAIGFAVFAAAFVALLLALYRPLFQRRRGAINVGGDGAA